MVISIRKILSWVLLLCWTMEASAAPTIQAPTPPAVVYRADSRAPETIWSEGFRSWATYLGSTDDTDLVAHVQGNYDRSSPGHTTNWVSTTQDLPSAEEIAWFSSFVEGLPEHVWIYDVAPTAEAYFVPWALSDFLQRHPDGSSRRATAAAVTLRIFGAQEEWAVRGGIPPQAIIQARRYDRVGQQRDYQDSGVRIPNPHYQSQPTPAPQTRNPLDGQWAEPASLIVLGYERPFSEAASGTMDERPISLGMSCLGIAPDSTYLSRRKRGIDSPAYCYDDPQHVVPVQRYTQLRYSPLAFTLHTSRTYCAWPRVLDASYRVSLDTCGSNPPQFLYDEHKRLYTRQAGLDWCMAAPSSVVDGGRDTWDHVTLEPCALNSVYQKWHIVEGKIHTHKGKYPMQDWKWSLIVSRNRDGYNNKLNPSSMTPGFFNSPSPSQSEKVELQMGWLWKGKTYYSNFRRDATWSQKYWNRSYYDYTSKRISYINMASSSAPRGPAWAYCLNSQIGHYKWNWTSWSRCRDEDSLILDSLRWVMKSAVDAYNDPDRVAWVSEETQNSLAPNQLWVQATGQPAGQYFSATQGSWSNATKIFSVRKDAIRLEKLVRVVAGDL